MYRVPAWRHLKDGDNLDPNIVAKHIKGKMIPTCPAKGIYDITWTVGGATPKCSVHGDAFWDLYRVRTLKELDLATQKSIDQAKWADKQAQFVVRLLQDPITLSYIAEIVISNKTDKTLSFPTPYVMPLCGDTNKNNLRVYDESGHILKIYYAHLDFSNGRPATDISAFESYSWCFDMEALFPELCNPGKYSVEFWYFSDANDKATWKGRTQMERLTLRIQ